MTPERAAEVLRGEVDSEITRADMIIAEAMGAEALEFQSWLFDLIGYGTIRVVSLYEGWHGEDSFLDYCKAEWEKERRG
jgi:hypothetical protein